MKNALTPEQDLPTWTAAFFAILEPRGLFKDFLRDLTKRVELFIKDRSQFSEEFQEYFLKETITGTIKRVIHFQEVPNGSNKDQLKYFFRQCAYLIDRSLYWDLEIIFPVLINMLDPEAILFQKISHYQNEFYLDSFTDYFRSNQALKIPEFFKNNKDVKLSHFNFIFKIYTNFFRTSKKTLIVTPAKALFIPYVKYLNSIENLRDFDTKILQDSISSFISLSSIERVNNAYMQLFEFLTKCLKSDMVEKQAIAAKSLSFLANSGNVFSGIYSVKTLRDELKKILDDSLNLSLNISVLNLFIPFYEMIIEKDEDATIFTFEQICQLFDLASHSDQNDQIFTFIANSIDNFDELLQENIIDYITRPPFSDATFKFLVKLSKRFWRNHSDKALQFVSMILIQTDTCQSAKDSFETICKQSTVPINCRVEFVKMILDKLSNSPDQMSIEFCEKVLCSMIESINQLRDVFTDQINTQIIEKMTSDNRISIFQIIVKLFSKSSINITKSDIELFAAFGMDDTLWNFYQKLFDTNRFYVNEAFNLIVDQIRSEINITLSYIECVISLIRFSNKSSFGLWSRTRLNLPSPKYFDILFNAYSICDDKKAINLSQEFLLLNFKEYPAVRSNLTEFIIQNKVELNYNVLVLFIKFIEKSETENDPEDFNCRRHFYPSSYIELFCETTDQTNFSVHIDPNQQLSVLLKRIATRIQVTSCTSTKFQKTTDLHKSLKTLEIQNHSQFLFSSSYTPEKNQEKPFSLYLMQNKFVQKLFDLLENCDPKIEPLIEKLLFILPTDKIIQKKFAPNFEFSEKLKSPLFNRIQKKYYLQLVLNNSELNDEFLASNCLLRLLDYITSQNDTDPFFLKVFNYFMDIEKGRNAILKGLKPLLTIIFDTIINHLENSYTYKLFKKCIEYFKEKLLKFIEKSLKEPFLLSLEKVQRKYWDDYSTSLSELPFSIIYSICSENILQQKSNFYYKLLLKSFKLNPEEKIEPNLFNLLIQKLIGKSKKKLKQDLINLIYLILQNSNESIDLNQYKTELFSLITEINDSNTLKTLLQIFEMSFKPNEMIDYVFHLLEISKTPSVQDHWSYSPEFYKKTVTDVGLRNLGATCFFNSIIQQLYHLYPVQYILSTYPFSNTTKGKEMKKLQEIFLFMHYSQRKFVDTEDFIEHWHFRPQEVINPREQHDAAEFFGYLLESMPKCIQKLFTGSLVNKIMKENGDVVHSDTEPFQTLDVDIKNMKSLNESIKKMIDYEPLDTIDDTTHQKIRVLKYLRIVQEPPILVIHLKRFDYDMKNYQKIKLNDKFSFPFDLSIDLLLENPDVCFYKLFGIVVHSGNAIGGHYTSYINKKADVSNDTWWKFNDTEVSELDFEEIQSVAFGNMSQQASAYMLFYIKEDFELDINQIEIDEEKQEEENEQQEKDQENGKNDEQQIKDEDHENTENDEDNHEQQENYKNDEQQIKDPQNDENQQDQQNNENNEQQIKDKDEDAHEEENEQNEEMIPGNENETNQINEDPNIEDNQPNQNQDENENTLNQIDKHDHFVSFFKELDYKQLVNIDAIRKDNKEFKNIQALFSEPIVDFVSNLKTDPILSLQFFLNIICHSIYTTQTIQFGNSLIEMIESDELNYEKCLRYLLFDIKHVFENFINISIDEISTKLSDVIVRISKNDISICYPILRLLRGNTYNFRQTPLIYDTIYRIIEVNTLNYINEKVIDEIDRENSQKTKDPFVRVFKKILKLIIITYTESKPQFFNKLDFTSLFRVSRKMFSVCKNKKEMEISNLSDFREMISKSPQYNEYIKLMKEYENWKRTPF